VRRTFLNPGFDRLSLTTKPGFHTHSGKNDVKYIIENKTNACYCKNDADGAQAVDVIRVASPVVMIAFHGTQN
jgi:hypothetical protein